MVEVLANQLHHTPAHSISAKPSPSNRHRPKGIHTSFAAFPRSPNAGMGSAVTAVLAAGLGFFTSLMNVDMLNNRAKMDGEDSFLACLRGVSSF